MKIIILARVLLSILILTLLYSLFDVFREIHRQGYIQGFLGSITDKYIHRKKNREISMLLEGEKEEKSFLERVDLLIERASLKVWLPFITSEILIVFTIFVAFTCAFIFQRISGVVVFSIAVFFSVIFLVFVLLKQLAKHTYDKIDDQVLIYINILENLASSNSDIVEIMEKSLPYIKEPLKSYSAQFIFECKKGLPIYKAFKNFENKIESKRFRQLLKNLEVCSKYEANYKEILTKSRVIMKNYFTEKERRKKEIREGRIAIGTVLILGVFLINLVSSFNDNLHDQLKHTFIGNIIIGYNLFVIMLALYKLITLDKINY